nr:MAG TPA: hypothetical protein [Caudoviricetes sp.]
MAGLFMQKQPRHTSHSPVSAPAPDRKFPHQTTSSN